MPSPVTCAAWVRRGVAKETPDKVRLSPEQLERLVAETQERLREGADGSDEEHGQTEDNSMDTATVEAAKPAQADGDQEEDTEKLNDDELAEYDLDKYDEEENTDQYGYNLDTWCMAGCTRAVKGKENPHSGERQVGGLIPIVYEVKKENGLLNDSSVKKLAVPSHLLPPSQHKALPGLCCLAGLATASSLPPPQSPGILRLDG
uniref:PWP1 homolog, endonuclein n=1 Tax=Crocodylus porosus TaxID=8502 RepID=A0A7M4FNZ6_CROPO